MAHSQRGWTGARTPSAIKRVRQGLRRRAINQPRRSAAKTLITKAVNSAGNGDAEQARDAMLAAVSALDLAAKHGAIHPNAAARRKSRLMLKVGAAMGGTEIAAGAKVARTTGKAAATKEAKARIAAGKATKAKGAQTAAGKARAALARSSREQAAETAKAEAPTKTTAAKTTAAKTTAAKTTKTTAAKTTAKATTKTTAKAATKPAAKSTTKATASKTSTATKSAAKPRASKTKSS